MNDMPSAREHGLYDLRRKRAAAAAGIVLALSVLAMFVVFDAALLALPATAFFAFLAMPSWIGAEARYPVLPAWRAVGEHLLGFGVPMAGVMLMYVVLNKGDPAVIGLIPFALIGAISYSVYRWRYLGAAMNRVRGARAGMPFVQRLWRHYLGYAAGLAAGVLASLGWRDLVPGATDGFLAEAAFIGSFLAAKTVVDASLPQPPLPATPVSAAALQLAAVSPIFFGLPWGAFVTGVVLSGFDDPLAVEVDATVIVYVAAGALIVFTAIAVVALVMEVISGDA